MILETAEALMRNSSAMSWLVMRRSLCIKAISSFLSSVMVRGRAMSFPPESLIQIITHCVNRSERKILIHQILTMGRRWDDDRRIREETMLSPLQSRFDAWMAERRNLSTFLDAQPSFRAALADLQKYHELTGFASHSQADFEPLRVRRRDGRMSLLAFAIERRS